MYKRQLQICEPPQGTQSYALVLEDRDAFAVTPGFSWIHWTAANLQRDFLEENESVSARDFVQGVNSWISEGLPLEDCTGYGGMAPPDCPHQYELRVYALDCLLPLEQGFLYGELYRAMEGHLLDSCCLLYTSDFTGAGLAAGELSHRPPGKHRLDPLESLLLLRPQRRAGGLLGQLQV